MRCGWCGFPLLCENARWVCLVPRCPMFSAALREEHVEAVHGRGPVRVHASITDAVLSLTGK